MGYCRKCGHEMQEGELFCSECGTKAEVVPVHDEEIAAVEKALGAAVEAQESAEAEERIAEAMKAEIAEGEMKAVEEETAEAAVQEPEAGANEEPAEAVLAQAEPAEAETEEAAPIEAETEEAVLQEPVGETEALADTSEASFEEAKEEFVGEAKEELVEEAMAAPAEEYATAKLDEADPVFCPNCGMKNEADGTFCQNCGAPLSEQPEPEVQQQPQYGQQPQESQGDPIFCPACGAKNDAADVFCQNCGANLHDNTMAIPPQPEPVKKKSKAPFIIGGVVAAAAIVAVAGFGISRLGGGKSETQSLKYYKDKGIYQYNMKSQKSLEVVSKAVTDDTAYYAVQGAMSRIAESKDGKYIFYIDSYDGYNGKLSFMDQKKQSDKNDTSQKIDTNVSSFRITDDNKVIYKKDTSSALYIYDIKKDEKDKIATDVVQYFVSEDGKSLVYINSDQDMYYKSTKPDSDKEKLDSDVSIYTWTKDLNMIYYTKDYNIYCIKNLKDKEKIASDAYIVGVYNDNSGIYYTEETDPVITAEDLLDDDMAAVDAAIKEPNKDDYTTTEQTWYGTHPVTDTTKYNAAKAAYEEKKERDALRQEIKNNEIYYLNDCVDIFAYDGTSHEILKNAMSPVDIGDADYVYYAYSWDEIELPKIKLSELTNTNDFTSRIYEAMEDIGEDGMDAFLIADGISVPFTYESNVEYTADGETKTIYAASYTFNETDYSYSYDELYSMKYSDKGVEKPVVLDDDLGKDFSNQYTQGGKLYYYKDYDGDDWAGTLYCNGEEIGDDVYEFYYDEDTGATYFLNDESKSYCGTLYRYESGKKPVKLADDVAYFVVMNDQYVAILDDYSSKRERGELKLISAKDGKKTKKVDEDVAYMQDGIGSYNLTY